MTIPNDGKTVCCVCNKKKDEEDMYLRVLRNGQWEGVCHNCCTCSSCGKGLPDHEWGEDTFCGECN